MNSDHRHVSQRQQATHPVQPLQNQQAQQRVPCQSSRPREYGRPNLGELAHPRPQRAFAPRILSQGFSAAAFDKAQHHMAMPPTPVTYGNAGYMNEDEGVTDQAGDNSRSPSPVSLPRALPLGGGHYRNIYPELQTYSSGSYSESGSGSCAPWTPPTPIVQDVEYAYQEQSTISSTSITTSGVFQSTGLSLASHPVVVAPCQFAAQAHAEAEAEFREMSAYHPEKHLMQSSSSSLAHAFRINI